MYPYQHDLPPWKTVYYHFRQWEKRGVLAQIRDALVKKARAQAGKDAPKLAPLLRDSAGNCSIAAP
jgi:putative transposase